MKPEPTPPRLPEVPLDVGSLLPAIDNHGDGPGLRKKEDPEDANAAKEQNLEETRAQYARQFDGPLDDQGTRHYLSKPNSSGPFHYDSDADTTCSADSAWDGSMEPSEQQFVEEFVQDIKSHLGNTCSKTMVTDYLMSAVRKFVCRLQEDTWSACGLEAAVIIQRHRE